MNYLVIVHSPRQWPRFRFLGRNYQARADQRFVSMSQGAFPQKRERHFSDF
jgi:hypothetical protein